jgi:hypothetical protein
MGKVKPKVLDFVLLGPLLGRYGKKFAKASLFVTGSKIRE